MPARKAGAYHNRTQVGAQIVTDGSLQEITTAAQSDDLPALIDRAAFALASAKTSGEVLEARDMARVAYDAAKTAARIARAKEAHDEIISAVYRAQGDAARIEARAKIRLADEYDAAQERGEVARLGTNQHGEGVTDGNTLPTAADIGLSCPIADPRSWTPRRGSMAAPDSPGGATP